MNSGKLRDFFLFFSFFGGPEKQDSRSRVQGQFLKPQGGKPLTANAPLVILLCVELWHPFHPIAIALAIKKKKFCTAFFLFQTAHC